MNNSRPFVFFFLVFLFSFPVFGQSEVSIIPIEEKITFRISDPLTRCGIGAAGCTVPVSYIPNIQIDCNTGKIILDFSNFEFEVQIVNRYKKGTAQFDHILKHELTHVALYKGVIEKFYQPISTAVLMRFEESRAQGKGCYQIHLDVYNVLYDYLNRMINECEKQNNLIDGEENYAYQWAQVVKNEEAIKEKAAPRAKVELVMLETRRVYNISPPDNIKVDKSSDPQAQGEGILKNLVTGASLELDRANLFLECQSGEIRLELGFLTTITFNEKRGTFLYDYLMDSLSQRVSLLEQRARNVPGRIKADVAKVYERLAKNGVLCRDIRYSLNKRMAAYQQKISEEVVRQNKIMGDAVPLWRQYFEKDMRAYAALQKTKKRQKEIIAEQQKTTSNVKMPFIFNQIPGIEEVIQTSSIQSGKASSTRLRPPLPQVKKKTPENAKRSETSEKTKTPAVSETTKVPEKTEIAEIPADQSVAADQKPVMGRYDRYYTQLIKRFAIRMMDEFQLKEKFDNFLKNIINTYHQIFSDDPGPMTRDTKAAENSK